MVWHDELILVAVQWSRVWMVEDGPERLIPPILWTCRSLAAAHYVGRPPLCGRPPAKVGPSGVQGHPPARSQFPSRWAAAYARQLQPPGGSRTRRHLVRHSRPSQRLVRPRGGPSAMQGGTRGPDRRPPHPSPRPPMCGQGPRGDRRCVELADPTTWGPLPAQGPGPCMWLPPKKRVVGGRPEEPWQQRAEANTATRTGGPAGDAGCRGC